MGKYRLSLRNSISLYAIPNVYVPIYLHINYAFIGGLHEIFLKLLIDMAAHCLISL